jgi:putative transposase
MPISPKSPRSESDVPLTPEQKIKALEVREYQAIRARYGIACSMTDGYDCYQNALAERVNGILKMEFLLQRPADLGQARKMVQQSVHIYNQERPHLSLQLKTPGEVHRASLAGLHGSAICVS